MEVGSNFSCQDFMVTFCSLDIVDLSNYLPETLQHVGPGAIASCSVHTWAQYIDACLLATVFRLCFNIQAACFILGGLSELLETSTVKTFARFNTAKQTRAGGRNENLTALSENCSGSAF